MWTTNRTDKYNTEAQTKCGRVECKQCSSNKKTIEERLKSRLDKEITFFNQEFPKYFVEGFNKAQKNMVTDESKSEYVERIGWQMKRGKIFHYAKKEETQTAYKETEGKLFYELDWGFITQMAERMATNKKESKYSLWNWKKPMTPEGIESLKQATLRHLIEVMECKYEDDGREFGHLEAIADNMMMLNYQLKLNK